MMDLQLWYAFVLATIVLLMIPGPTIILVLTYALTQGRKPAVLGWMTRLGGGVLVAMGVATAMLRRAA